MFKQQSVNSKGVYPKKNYFRVKNILGLVLLNFYFFMSIGTFFAFLGTCYFNQKIDFDGWLALGESLFFLLAGICVLLKLKFKSNLIWWGVFDFIAFPLAIPFYFYLYKDRRPIGIIELPRFQVAQWSLIQLTINFSLLLFSLGAWITMFVISQLEPYRNLVLGFVLFGFLSTLLGTLASWLNYLSIKRSGRINKVFLWISLLFFGFGWPFPLTWLIFKPKIKISNMEIVNDDILKFEKRIKK